MFKNDSKSDEVFSTIPMRDLEWRTGEGWKLVYIFQEMSQTLQSSTEQDPNTYISIQKFAPAPDVITETFAVVKRAADFNNVVKKKEEVAQRAYNAQKDLEKQMAEIKKEAEVWQKERVEIQKVRNNYKANYEDTQAQLKKVETEREKVISDMNELRSHFGNKNVNDVLKKE